MSVTVRVEKVQTEKAEAEGGVAKRAALAAYVMAARRDSEPYVPYLTGDLRRSAETESDPGKASLKYGSGGGPHARPQYYGCPRKTTPGTTTRWFDAAKAAHGAIWAKEAELAAKEAVGR